MGFDLFSAGLISDGSIKSALGVKQEDKSALTGKCLVCSLGKGTELLKRGENSFL